MEVAMILAVLESRCRLLSADGSDRSDDSER